MCPPLPHSTGAVARRACSGLAQHGIRLLLQPSTHMGTPVNVTSACCIASTLRDECRGAARLWLQRGRDAESGVVTDPRPCCRGQAFEGDARPLLPCCVLPRNLRRSAYLLAGQSRGRACPATSLGPGRNPSPPRYLVQLALPGGRVHVQLQRSPIVSHQHVQELRGHPAEPRSCCFVRVSEGQRAEGPAEPS